MMKIHKRGVVHKAVVSALKQEKLDQLNDVKHVEKPEHLVTNRIFRTVYYSILNNVAFNSHNSLVNLQVTNGAVMGHLCNSRQSAKKIANSISDQMHQELLTFLKREQPYFSLILDESKYLNNFKF